MMLHRPLSSVVESSHDGSPEFWDISIVIFTAADSERCSSLRKVLDKQLLQYTEINVDSNLERLEEMFRRSGSWCVPQVFANSRPVGGLEEILSLDKSKFALQLGQRMEDARCDHIPLNLTKGRTMKQIVIDGQWKQKKESQPPVSLENVVERLKNPKSGLAFQDVRERGRIYKRCFPASELLDFLLFHLAESVQNRAHAVEIAMALLQQGYMSCLFSVPFEDSDRCLCQFLDQKKTNKRKVLNNFPIQNLMRRASAVEISASILRYFMRLYAIASNNVIQTENRLRKLELSESQTDAMCAPLSQLCFEVAKGREYFQQHVVELRNIKLEETSVWDRLAIFSNVHNTLYLHGLFVLGTEPLTRMHHKQLREQFTYIVAGEEYSLDDIEYGILRGNVWRGLLKGRCIGKKDPRLPLVPDRVDPRILLCLIAHHSSLTQIPVLTGGDTDDETLTQSLRDILNDQQWCEIDERDSTLTLPAIFESLSAHLGDMKEDIVAWVSAYMEPTRLAKLIGLKDRLKLAFHRGNSFQLRLSQYSHLINYHQQVSQKKDLVE